MNKYHKIVLEKEGKILENRTKYKDILIGDLFHLQSLSDPYEVLFFFKDKLFDHSPMIFGLNRKTNSVIMCSAKLVEIINKNQNGTLPKTQTEII